MSGPQNALAAWGSSALQFVELPSGTRMLVKLPNVAKLLSTGQFPQDLRKIAAKYVQTGIELKELDEAGLREWLDFTYDLIARTVRSIADPAADPAPERPGDDGWQAVTLTSGEVREMEIDEDDLDAISNIAHRRTSCRMVTYASRMERGLLDEQARKQAEHEIADGGGDTLDQLATFRGQPGGAVGGDDRGAVGLTAVGAARGGGPRRRTGRRRGGGA